MRKIIMFLLLMALPFLGFSQNFDFKIEDNHAILTDLGNNKVVFATPKKDLRYKISDNTATQGQTIIFYDGSIRKSIGQRKGYLIAEVANNGGAVFDEPTLRTLLHQNTGNNSGGGPTSGQTAAQVNTAITSANNIQDTNFAASQGAQDAVIATKENALGNPPTDGYALVSEVAGDRAWVLLPPFPIDEVLAGNQQPVKSSGIVTALQGKEDISNRITVIRDAATASEDRYAVESAVRNAINAINFAGVYKGSSASFAGLPAGLNGDWAALTADDGGNLSGIYATDGTTYSLVKAIPDIGVINDPTIIQGAPAYSDIGTVSVEKLDQYVNSRTVRRVFNSSTDFDFNALGYIDKMAIYVRNSDPNNGINVIYGTGGAITRNITSSSGITQSISGEDSFNLQPNEIVFLEKEGSQIYASVIPGKRVNYFDDYAQANAMNGIAYDAIVVIRDRGEIWGRKTNTNTAQFPTNGVPNNDWFKVGSEFTTRLLTGSFTTTGLNKVRHRISSNAATTLTIDTDLYTDGDLKEIINTNSGPVSVVLGGSVNNRFVTPEGNVATITLLQGETISLVRNAGPFWTMTSRLRQESGAGISDWAANTPYQTGDKVVATMPINADFISNEGAIAGVDYIFEAVNPRPNTITTFNDVEADSGDWALIGFYQINGTDDRVLTGSGTMSFDPMTTLSNTAKNEYIHWTTTDTSKDMIFVFNPSFITVWKDYTSNNLIQPANLNDTFTLPANMQMWTHRVGNSIQITFESNEGGSSTSVDYTDVADGDNTIFKDDGNGGFTLAKGDAVVTGPAVERTVIQANRGTVMSFGDFQFRVPSSGNSSLQYRVPSGVIAVSDFITKWSNQQGGASENAFGYNLSTSWAYFRLNGALNLTLHNSYQDAMFSANGWTYRVEVIVGSSWTNNRFSFTRWRQEGVKGEAGNDGVNGIDGIDGRSIITSHRSDGTTAIGGTVYTLDHIIYEYSDSTYQDMGLLIAPASNPSVLLGSYDSTAFVTSRTFTLPNGRTWQNVLNEFEFVYFLVGGNNLFTHEQTRMIHVDDLTVANRDISLTSYQDHGTNAYHMKFRIPFTNGTTITVDNDNSNMQVQRIIVRGIK